MTTELFLSYDRALGAYNAEVVTDRHFGVNLLFDRDRNILDSSGSTVSPNFDAAMRELGVQTFRYPGGTLTERFFNIETAFDQINPTISGASGAFDPDRTEPLQPATLSVIGALDYADANHLSISIVMPTYRFLGTIADAQGHRAEAVDVRSVTTFVTSLLTEAANRGVPVAALELGNEWWADNRNELGTIMSPVEYGRIASRLATVIQDAIDGFRASYRPTANWSEPDIVVQTGPGGAAERYLPTGYIAPSGHSGPFVSATELIFREFEQLAERTAIDGTVTHRYLTGSVANADGWAYKPFDTFEKLALKSSGFGELDRYVTEWNVAARNDSELGARHAGALVSLFAEMISAGVDHANIWTIQQNNASRLASNAGFAGEGYGGLTFGGEVFRLMQKALPGLALAPVSDNAADVRTYAFADSQRVVLYLINDSSLSKTISLDINSIAPGAHYGSAVLLGNQDQPSAPVLNIISGSSLLVGSVTRLTLDPNEVAQIELLIGANGAKVDGHSANDVIDGSNYSDLLSGFGGNDTLRGGPGDDTLEGDEGVDRLVGGNGDDQLRGGSGIDYLEGGRDLDSLWGGDGSDVINGGAGNDELLGETGDDQLLGDVGHDALFGGEGSDTLDGGPGQDTLTGGAGNDLFIGGVGADVFVFEAGADTIRDFQDGIDRIDLRELRFDTVADVFLFAHQHSDSVVFDFLEGRSLTVASATIETLWSDLII